MPKRVTTIFSGVQGAPYYSNMYFSDASDSEECVDVVGDFWDNCGSMIVNECSWTVQGDVVTIDLLTGQPTDVDSVTGQNSAGTAAGEMMARASQMLVSWQTGQFINGRLLRGRTNIPALSVSAIDEGSVVAGFITTAHNAALQLINDPDASFGIYSRTHSAFSPVLTDSVWNQFAVLRSRRD